MKQRLQRWRQAAATLLAQRTPAERRALGLLAWVLLLAIVVQAGWSLEQARRTQLRHLPQLAAQAEQVAALDAALRQLAVSGSEPLRGDVLQTALSPRLSELGPQIAATWPAPGRLQLSGEAELAVWLRWTAAMQAEHRLVLERGKLTGNGNRVRIDASYRVGGQP